jgi:hypothetical protein
MKPLYCKGEQVEMRTYYWEHIKIMLMILLSHICQLSNLFAYQFLNKLTCAILMKLQIYFFRLVSFILILVVFIKASQLSSFPCWYLRYLWHIGGWSSSIYNKINWAFGHALKAKNLIGILHDFILDIMFYSYYLFCVYMFLCDNYLCDIVYLETYTHERWYLLIWYLICVCWDGMLSNFIH